MGFVRLHFARHHDHRRTHAERTKVLDCSFNVHRLTKVEDAFRFALCAGVAVAITADHDARNRHENWLEIVFACCSMLASTQRNMMLEVRERYFRCTDNEKIVAKPFSHSCCGKTTAENKHCDFSFPYMSRHKFTQSLTLLKYISSLFTDWKKLTLGVWVADRQRYFALLQD